MAGGRFAMKMLVSVSVLAVIAAAVSFSLVERPSPAARRTPIENAEGTRLLGRLPVAFVPNLGQWEHSAHYVARIGAMTVFLQDKGWTFTLLERTAKMEKGWRRETGDAANGNCSARGAAVRMTFAGAAEPELVAED